MTGGPRGQGAGDGGEHLAHFLLTLQEECGGSVPFERFMKEALYHPKFGYYTANIRTVGRGGDFSTWPTLDASLAKALVATVRQSGLRDVIEVGAGSGALAGGILRELGFFGRRKIRYRIVEASPVLARLQQAALPRRRVRWHASLSEALQDCSGQAFLFSNEVVDAFPCRLFERGRDGWNEVHVRFERGRALEHLLPCEPPATTLPLGEFAPGMRIECHPSYREWMKSWLPHWRAGVLLTIDYGSRAPGLYHRRPRGSLRAYAHQQRLEGDEVYKAFGRRDLTADVNFDDLMRWGTEDGLRTEAFLSLSEFVRSKGLVAPSRLLAAGEAFCVLHQSRGQESRFP